MSLPNSLSRRSFIHAGAASLLLPAACVHRADLDGLIDAHVHVWTPDVKRYPISEGFTVEKDMKPASFTPEEYFAHSKPCGVTRTVLIQMSFYTTNNQYMLDVIKAHPGVFGGVAIVDESAPDLEATMKRLKARGVRGFRIYTSRDKAGHWFDSAGMRRMWAVAGEEGLSMCLLADPDALPMVNRMCREYPGTRVVIDHFARIGMKGGIVPSDLEALCRLSKFPNTHVKTSAFYALGLKKPPYRDLGPMIRALRDSFGASRLMWASDCPYQVEGEHSYKASIELIRSGLDFLTTEDRQWMLRKTAEKVFFS